MSRTILTRVSGFLAEAGFTHSLSPARNCTFGCTYCYVPTMGVFGGLKPEDVRRWGQFTTFKENADGLLRKQMKGGEVIYCSPLVDPYQPAEFREAMMPKLLRAFLVQPPKVLVLQTRGPMILRDIELLQELSYETTLRISFSVTTNDDCVRKLYEPKCASISERLSTLRTLRRAGLEAYATLAPLLPGDPEELARLAWEATGRDLIGDPLHVRAAKPRGGTTWGPAFRIAEVQQHQEWFEPQFQGEVVQRIAAAADRIGCRFGVGPAGFGWLAATSSSQPELSMEE